MMEKILVILNPSIKDDEKLCGSYSLKILASLVPAFILIKILLEDGRESESGRNRHVVLFSNTKDTRFLFIKSLGFIHLKVCILFFFSTPSCLPCDQRRNVLEQGVV